jgi:hypothetical protein
MTDYQDHYVAFEMTEVGLPVAAGQFPTFSIAVVVSTVDMPCV